MEFKRKIGEWFSGFFRVGNSKLFFVDICKNLSYYYNLCIFFSFYYKCSFLGE